MEPLRFDKKTVQMIAHRGASGIEPENTLSAFVAAGNRSYYGVETDVHVTGDGKFVVIHDEQTGRLTGENLVIRETPFDTLRRLRVYNLCDQERLAGMTEEQKGKRDDLFIPTLSEYIGVMKKYGKKCILHLNGHVTADDQIRIKKEFEDAGYLDGVVFISFTYAHMTFFREIMPDQPLQYLIAKPVDDLVKKLNDYNLDLDIRYDLLTRDLLNEVHANGHKVNVWTCDSIEEAEKLADWGVDFITSNLLE